MLTIKGFVRIPSFINNVENQVAAIGELSLVSQTFSKDRQDFQDPAKDASSLVIFSCKDNGVTTVMPVTLQALCLDIMETAFNTFVTNKTFLVQLMDAFPALVNVQTGGDITHSGKALNHWFSFDYTDSGVPVSIKLWLTDTSFKAEYDLYDIIVVPPCASLESYHDTLAAARSAKDTYSVSVRNDEVNTVIGSDPQTTIDIIELTWVNPLNPDETLLTEWSLVCYGTQASVFENKLQAIRDYLVANSSHDIASWITFFPELNNIDIFYLFPQWDRVSLSSGASPTGSINQYSTFALYDKGMDTLRKVISTTSLTVLKRYTDIFSHVFKSIMIYSVGSENNSVGNQRLSEVFPKYTVMNINDINLGRLPADLQEFIRLLERVLAQAEVDDGVLLLPNGMVRKQYGGAAFIEVVYNSITYRVCTRVSYLPLV